MRIARSFTSFAVGLLALGALAPAEAEINLSVGIGAPTYYSPPPPVFVPAPPVYYPPPPSAYYRPPPAYYAPAPAYYGPPPGYYPPPPQVYYQPEYRRGHWGPPGYGR